MTTGLLHPSTSAQEFWLQMLTLTPRFDKGHTPMLEQAEHLMEGVSWATIILGAFAAYMAYRHGIPWVWAKMQSIWGSIKGGSVRLENLIAISVDDVHQRVDELAARVQVLESKPAVVVNVPPAPPPVVHVTPTPSPSVPVNPAPPPPTVIQPLSPMAVAQAPAAPSSVTTGGPHG